MLFLPICDGNLTVLDYSLVNPSNTNKNLEGVTLLVGSKDQVFGLGLLDVHSPKSETLLRFGAGSLSTPSLETYGYLSPQIAIRGSQLNDTISVSNELVLTAEGLGGDDHYIIDALFLPGNSRFGYRNQTSLSSSPFSLPEALKMPRATFLYDAQGHSTVSLGDGAIESLYRYGANLINLDLTSIISSRVADFISKPSSSPTRVERNGLITYSVPLGNVITLPSDFETNDLPSWSLDLSRVTKAIDTSNTYHIDASNTLQPVFYLSDNETRVSFQGRIYTDMPKEIVLGNFDNVFDPASIWDTFDYHRFIRKSYWL